jgi:C_GCAxxG_C_C family probable redox protein
MDVFYNRRCGMTKKELFELTESRFMSVPGYNCAQTVLTCMADYLGIENDALKNIAAPFGGGLSGIRVSVCGAVSGGLMVIGLMEKGNSGAIGKELIAFIKENYGDINCDKILDIDFNDKVQVQEEKDIKKKSICLPMINDVCDWLAERYSQ